MINSIIAIRGEVNRYNSTWQDHIERTDHCLPVTRNLCAYCGQRVWQTQYEELSRDHVVPTSKGGEDVWTNVVTSCLSRVITEESEQCDRWCPMEIAVCSVQAMSL